MDVILSHFSAAELRVKCLTAVQDELRHAERQLQPALGALKRALSVVHASRKMYRAPLVLVDASPEVSRALETLVAGCNEIGALVYELNREVSSAGSGDASPSATDDEGGLNMRAEPKSGTEAVVERKKAAKETCGRRSKESKVEISGSVAAAPAAAVIDLSLSDEEKEPAVVKDELMAVMGESDAVKKEEKKKSSKDVAGDRHTEVRRLNATELSALLDAGGDDGVGESASSRNAVNIPVAAMKGDESEAEVVGPRGEGSDGREKHQYMLRCR